MEPDWAFILFRTFVFSAISLLLYLSQRFWFVGAWRLIGRVGHPRWRRLLCGAWVGVLCLLIIPFAGWMLHLRIRFWLGKWTSLAIVGLWLSSALLAYLGVKTVAALEWLWSRLRPRCSAAPNSPNLLVDPSRRYFFQRASYMAGAVPFVGAFYGFAAERLRYEVERVEVPIPGLPDALDGLRVAQLSDIHIGPYLPAAQVRRAVEMANALGAEMAVVTGDFITGPGDPLEVCVAELARLRAPLGIWGCNGNHEIYADAEALAAELFRRAGMRILREENVELRWRGQGFNLIGVDYQRTRTPSGRRLPMLPRVERLVRRDVPNLLLSHNPNAFPRAAELGIQLTLAGHTHGGQVQVEILNRQITPVRFLTPFTAGLYQRPLGLAPESWTAGYASAKSPARLTNPLSVRSAPGFLYVNRGLGTIGAPVRIGVPPEITLLMLRRA